MHRKKGILNGIINATVLINVSIHILSVVLSNCCVFFNKFIYYLFLFLAVLSPRCCARAFSSCGERGLLFVAVHGLLTAVASLVVEHEL